MMLIEAADNEPNDELDEVAMFIIELLDESEDEEDTSEFDAWVCHLLDLYDDNDRSQDAYMVDMKLTDISKAMNDVSTYATFTVYNHHLIDTDDPKSICSEDWAQRAKWYPFTKIPLP